MNTSAVAMNYGLRASTKGWAVHRTIESSFAFQPNFAALGDNGATYLRQAAAQSGLKFDTAADGSASLITRLGGGKGTVVLRAAQVDFGSGRTGSPNNGFTLTYEGLTSSECVQLITSTAARTTRTDVGQSVATVLVSDNGKLIVDKGAIARACSPGPGVAVPPVILSFAPDRAIAASPVVSATPAAQCAPVRETQLLGCPIGQVGTIRQERDGTCTGANNTLVYTAWNTVEDTCQNEASAPPDLVATPPVEVCSTATFSRVLPCSAGQIGHHFQTRTFDTCAGTYSAWETSTNSCHAPEPATCFPATEQQTTVACPSGLSGNQMRTRSSTCPSPTGTPVWTDWTTYANTCQGMPTCAPLRDTRTIRCAAGFWGDYFAHQEQFRACNSGSSVGGWSGWTNYEDAAAGQFTTGSCTACPPNATETDLRWVNRSAACSPGSAGSNTWQAQQISTRTRYYNCPAGTLTLPAVSYTAWSTFTDTGTTQSHVNTCAACPSPQTESEYQTVACPSGQLGAIEQQRTRTRTYACSGAGSWNAWSAWSTWSTTSNTCAVACVPPAPEQETNVWSDTSRTDACPAGQVGTGISYRRDITDRRERQASCPSSTGAPVWGAWSNWVRINEGPWIETGRNCAGACVAPAPEQETNVWSDTSRVDACPAGQVGTGISYRRDITDRRERQASCPSSTGAPVWGAWGNWVRINEGPWIETSRNCAVACVAPAPSSTGITRALADQTQNVGCPAGQTGAHMQTRTVTEHGTRTTSWTCPGPTSSTSETWGGGITHGAWTTTSNTCAAPAPVYRWRCTPFFDGHWRNPDMYGDPSCMWQTGTSPTPPCAPAPRCDITPPYGDGLGAGNPRATWSADP